MATNTEARMLKIVTLSSVLFFTLGLLVYLTTTTAQTVDIDQWNRTRDYPFSVAGRNALVHGDFLYVFGGGVALTEKSEVQAATNAVRIAKINSDGSLGDWNPTTGLPHQMYNHAVAANDTHVYLVGGWDTAAPGILRGVWRAPFRQNGGLGPWQSLGDFPISAPEGINLHTVEVVGNRLYVLGGWNGKNALDKVMYAVIQSGGIGPWFEAPNSLPHPIARADSAQFNGYVYIAGGGYRVTNQPDAQFADVYYAKINADSSLGPWKTATSLDNPIYYHQLVVHDGKLVVLGGRNNGGITDRVWSNRIQADGSLANWASGPRLDDPIFRFAAVSLRRFGSDYIYTVGGWGDGDKLYNTVFHSAPPPTYTPTPTPGIKAVMANAPNHWVAPDDEVTYEISLIGNDVADFTDVTLTNKIPAQTELVPDSVIAGNGIVNVEGESAGSTIQWIWSQFSQDDADTVSYRVRRLPPPTPDVPLAFTIEKRGPATAAAGEPIVYTLSVVNNMPIAVEDVWIEDTMPIGATYVGGADGPPENGIVRWTVPTFAANQRQEFQLTVKADQTLVNSLYGVRSRDGANIRGQTVVVTVVDNTAPPPSGDGIAILNEGAEVQWTVDGKTDDVRTNAVRNPFDAGFLPIITR